jgi:hypothetical protein
MDANSLGPDKQVSRTRMSFAPVRASEGPRMRVEHLNSEFEGSL